MSSNKRGGVSATPRLGMKRGSPSNGDFSQALQQLDEDTMSQACSLLLSERDYNASDDTNNGESDYDKLVAIFVKCRDAALKVEQQMPIAPLPNLAGGMAAPPATSATTPSARAAAKKAHLMNAMSPPRRMSLKQKMAARSLNPKNIMGSSDSHKGSSATGMHRTGKLVVGGPITAAGGSARPPLKREPSDSSIASSSSASSRASTNHKKARITSSNTSNNAPFPPEGKKAAAPPQAALNFLQALNSQQKKEKREKRTAAASTPKAPAKAQTKAPAKAPAKAPTKAPTKASPKVVEEPPPPPTGRMSRARAAKNASANNATAAAAAKPETRKRTSPRTRY